MPNLTKAEFESKLERGNDVMVILRHGCAELTIQGFVVVQDELTYRISFTHTSFGSVSFTFEYSDIERTSQGVGSIPFIIHLK